MLGPKLGARVWEPSYSRHIDEVSGRARDEGSEGWPEERNIGKVRQARVGGLVDLAVGPLSNSTY